MAEDASPKLLDYLATQKSSSLPCWCEGAPAEAVEQVNAAVASGSRQWAAMCRWLLDEYGIVTVKHRVEGHFQKGHHLA